MIRITHVEIENFRSIKELELNPSWLGALVGPNNAGKSNILAALDFVLGQNWPIEARLEESDYFRRDTDLKPRVSVAFTFEDEGGYEDEMRFEFGPTPGQDELKLRYWGEGAAGTYAYRELRERFSLIRLDVNRSLQKHQPTNRWTILGRMLREINEELRQDEARMKEFTDTMEHLKTEILASVPGFQTLVEVVKEESARQLQRSVDEVDVDFSLHDPWNFYRTLQLVVTEGGMTLRADQMGMGLQSSLVIALLRAYAKIARHDRAVIAIEEPELFLHPLAQRQFYSLLRELAYPDTGPPLQILYTTHSSQMLDLEHFDEICLVSKTSTDEPSTKCTTLDYPTVIEALHAAGIEDATRESTQARLASTFDRSRTEGVFASAIVLVEGASEQMALPVYAEAFGLDLDAANIAVVAAGGKTGIPTLYRIFSGLKIPSYVIWDGDRSKGEHGDINLHIAAMLGADLVEFPESEVTSTYAVWTEDFETQLHSEVADYSFFEDTGREVHGTSSKGVLARHCATEICAGLGGLPPSIRDLLGNVKALVKSAPGEEPVREEPELPPTPYDDIPF